MSMLVNTPALVEFSVLLLLASLVLLPSCLLKFSFFIGCILIFVPILNLDFEPICCLVNWHFGCWNPLSWLINTCNKLIFYICVQNFSWPNEFFLDNSDPNGKSSCLTLKSHEITIFCRFLRPAESPFPTPSRFWPCALRRHRGGRELLGAGTGGSTLHAGGVHQGAATMVGNLTSGKLGL